MVCTVTIPVSYTHLDVYKRQHYGCVLWATTKKDGKIQTLEMAFSRVVKRCSKLDLIRNKAIREELKVFNLNEKLKDYKQQWREHL